MSLYRSVMIAAGLLAGVTALAQEAPAESQVLHRQRVAIERLPPKARTADQQAQLARLYHRAGRLSEAKQEVDRALQRRADNADMLLLLGDLQGQRNQWRQALATFDRLAQLRPRQAGVQLRRGQALMALGRTAEADAAFARYRALQATGGRAP